jgi:hypothetical protein
MVTVTLEAERGPSATDTVEIEALPVETGDPFVRGDANADGSIDIADAIALLGFLFGGAGPLACDDAGDTNDDETLNIADTIRLLGFLFGSDPPPPPPFGQCGSDPTGDSGTLGCASFPENVCP